MDIYHLSGFSLKIPFSLLTFFYKELVEDPETPVSRYPRSYNICVNYYTSQNYDVV